MRITKCPVCLDLNYTPDNETEICRACRFDINYCNKQQNHTCFDCINITRKMTLEEGMTFTNIKERKTYGCHKGSRLAKYCKKNKIDKLDAIKLLRWGI